LGIPPLSQKIREYRNKWKARMQRMEHTHIPLQACKYQPSGKRDIDRPRKGWKETQYYRPEQEILLIHEAMIMMIYFSVYVFNYEKIKYSDLREEHR
jgi:hypothetical protein